MSIYDKSSLLKQHQMFFGDGHFIQEFLTPAYPWALKSADRQNAQDWAWDEFSLKLDAAQLSTANNAIRHIFTSNLQSQIFADTIQGRGPAWLVPYLSDPSLEYAFIQWGRFECLTPDHEVLTPRGWVPINTVTLKDEVAQWDQNNKLVSFVNPTHIVKKPHQGDMYHITSSDKSVDQLVTPNHRLPLAYPYSFKGPTESLAQDIKYHGSNAAPISGYVLDGIGMSPLEKIFVAVQADGSLSSEDYTGEKTGTLAYKFKFKKQRKVNRLLSLVKDAGLESRLYHTADNYQLIYVDVPLEDYRKDVKSFDWVHMDKVSLSWIEDFIQELTYWDGCRSGGILRYTSSNKVAIDFVVTLSHLAGYRAKVCTVPPTTRVFPGNIERNVNSSYQVTFNKREVTLGNTITKELIKYEGDVYCLTVPSSFFLVRRNGAISVTGNCLHSRTYTNILTSMYPNPRIVLDMIEQKPEVFARFSQCVKAYDEFFAEPSKENLVILIAAINILEGLAFYASFICNFAFANMGLFESVSKYLKLIARDEALHLGLTQQIINQWRKGKDGKEWKDLWNKNKDRIRDMYVAAVHEEYEWSKYLFQYGTPIVGLNEEVLNRCIEYYANKRMKNIGLKEFNNVTKDPLPWVQTKYLSNTGVQDAPQEVSVAAYLKGSIYKVEDLSDISSLFKKHDLLYD